MIFSEKLLNQTVTLTVSTNPASATCTLTYGGNSYTSKSASVPKGTVISYSVYQSTYGTTTGSITMDKDKTLTCNGTYSTSTSEVSWSQPTLTSTTGSASGFSIDSYKRISGSYVTNLYKALDNNTSTGATWNSSPSASNPSGFVIYNNYPLKITSISVRNSANYFVRAYKVYGYNDSWTKYTLLDTSSTGGKNGTWTMDLSSNTNYYYYYEFDWCSATRTDPQYSDRWVSINEMTITAKYKSTYYNYYWNKSIS